ncbi:MAG TPA: malectin domain-containing carbohydrate-binding protein, partial [Bacillota bacterium]|nr:malectin domain-containing carbohydrate-binding protein [Bacillota bacterium]
MSNFRIQKVFILMLLVSVISIIGAMSTVQSAITGPVKIMPVGDSVTAGIGSTGNGSYRTDLYKHYTNAGLSIDFVGSQSSGPSSLPDKNHEGHSGWVISQIASNVNNWLNTYNPDVMLLMIGGNDTLQGTVPTSALSSLIDQITNQKPNLYLFVADYYYSLPSNQNYQLIVQYDAAIPGLVQQKANAGKHVYFVKLSDAQLSTSEYADGLHPTDSGYSKLATIWNRDTTSIIKSLVGGATPTPTRPGGPTPTPVNGSISIAAGSSSAVGSFQADQYYSGGSTYSNTNTVDVSQITSNPPPAALFNNERYGAMNYTIPGLTAGNSYEVTLYFAETYLSSSGSRRFNVSINGATALSNFDIYASAGGQNKAIARSFTATANANGQIVIQFTSVTENPKINGISIKPAGSNPTPTPTPTGTVNTPT